MDWYTLIGFVITWLLGLLGLGIIIKELKEAIAATSDVVTQGSEVLTVIATALEDGAITGEELKAIVKESKDVADAGKVAGKEWQDFFGAIRNRIGGNGS